MAILGFDGKTDFIKMLAQDAKLSEKHNLMPVTVWLAPEVSTKGCSDCKAEPGRQYDRGCGELKCPAAKAV
jgi:hypothetical protein